MGANSNIEWTHHTFNPWIGCTHVSPGCVNCYAETMMDKRYGKVEWGKGKPRQRTSVANWRKPLQWNKQAASEGVRYRVFCASLADVFDEEVPSEWRADLFDLIQQTPSLDWLLLTKRPEHIRHMVPGDWLLHKCGWPSNIWLGTSVEDQRRADERIPELLRIPAAVRFLSCEPLLGPVDLRRWLGIHADDCLSSAPLPTGMGNWHCTCGASSHTDSSIDWVIAGGESGAGARPMHPDWPRSLRDQCNTAGVAFHFKQWGEYWPAGHSIIENKSSVIMDNEVLYRVGKHAAGRLLDGREWNEFPT